MKKLILVILSFSMMGLATVSFASASEKAQATSDQVTGSAESAAGGLVGSDKMKAEGKSKKLKGDLRSTKEDIKDKAKDIID
jgi:uncharacterized protein YjbJ (UPF0337 family)